MHPATALPTVSPAAGARGAPAVQLVDVTRTYTVGPVVVPALRGVSLALPAGSFTAIMGPSGSGKSTLLACAAGLDTPTSGRVVVGGVETTRMSADALTRFRREHVGFVFQSYNLVGHLTVAENLVLPLLLAGRRAEPVRVEAALAAVGLLGLERRRPGELSGGQAQRVAIARALLARPTVLLADEPTGALDSRTGAEVLAVLRRLAAESGQTVVLVTHDPAVAAAADAVLFLADGRLVDRLDAPTAATVADRMRGLGR
ncbi:ABC transporter ATP-binding protein [Luteimicrobium sp. DT211]|uniref:ABC transporter ATP-binding protein n=1 Tax=Luteimicrobium sp. DT211 TaxID=3393412 RepID=UPI003CE92DD7